MPSRPHPSARDLERHGQWLRAAIERRSTDDDRASETEQLLEWPEQIGSDGRVEFVLDMTSSYTDREPPPTFAAVTTLLARRAGLADAYFEQLLPGTVELQRLDADEYFRHLEAGTFDPAKHELPDLEAYRVRAFVGGRMFEMFAERADWTSVNDIVGFLNAVARELGRDIVFVGVVEPESPHNFTWGTRSQMAQRAHEGALGTPGNPGWYAPTRDLRVPTTLLDAASRASGLDRAAVQVLPGRGRSRTRRFPLTSCSRLRTTSPLASSS